MQLVRCRPKRRSLRLRRRTCMRSEQRFRSERPSCPGTFIRLQNFVQVLLGRLCFQGVSWLLLCTSKEVTRCPQDSGSFALASKEVTRCPQDSGSFALASKEVTRSACGRAEALLWSASNPRAGRERKTAGRAWRKERDHFPATPTRAFGATSPARGRGAFPSIVVILRHLDAPLHAVMPDAAAAGGLDHQIAADAAGADVAGTDRVDPHAAGGVVD